MGKGGALRAGLNGRFNVGGRVSVFQILSRGSAARRVVAVGALLLTLDVILSAAAQWLAAGRRIHFSYSLRHDASDIVGLALLRVLVLPIGRRRRAPVVARGLALLGARGRLRTSK